MNGRLFKTKKLAGGSRPFTSTGVKTWRSIGGAMAIIITIALQAQPPEPDLPRPGAVVVTQAAGGVFLTAGDQRKPIKTDDRLRTGATLSTERKSFATLAFSNGATFELGSETELEIEEFGQAPVSGSLKFNELKEEPTISRTRLRLLRGDISVEVKPLKTSRGSSFTVAMPAGTLRTAEAAFRMVVEMSDLGVGVCTLELQRGAADFELAGAAFAPVPLGRKLAFAVEVDKATGAVKIGEMPKDTPAPVKAAK